MWILIGCTLFWLGVGAILYKRRERKIRKLILYLSHIQDRISLPPFESYSEGQLGILQSEIYKVVNLLEEQSRQSKEQNTYGEYRQARAAMRELLTVKNNVDRVLAMEQTEPQQTEKDHGQR